MPQAFLYNLKNNIIIFNMESCKRIRLLNRMLVLKRKDLEEFQNRPHLMQIQK